MDNRVGGSRLCLPTKHGEEACMEGFERRGSDLLESLRLIGATNKLFGVETVRFVTKRLETNPIWIATKNNFPS
jgi:hypothetical protein